MNIEITPASTAIGAAGLVILGMVPLLAKDLYRNIKGEGYATKSDVEEIRAACKQKHDAERGDCDACKAATKASICSIQHEGAKNRKLLLLIAIKLQVPQDELKDYL